ncbi:MAG: glucans biosynthesis glucosyltransferase MdoH [Acetobacteraceae bacterium]|nr:glucans biosynthesis glucosyltransferase MdoH [Acetobacteraceae bacterium]
MTQAPERLRCRRAVMIGMTAGIALAMPLLAARMFAAGGWTLCEKLILACLGATGPWVGLAAATAVAGVAVRLLSPDPPGFVLPSLRTARSDAPILARTVIAVCVRLEDMRAVLPPLGRLLEELRGGAGGDRFALAILSDTPGGQAALHEEQAVARFARRYPPDCVRYRRRAINAGWKAGNLMEFFDRHAEGFDFALLLDADSVMTAAAVRRLIRVMQADDTLAVLQQAVAGRPGHTVFSRAFGFGHRYSVRIWATGQAWWQGPEGAYWGHNALLRIAPFRAHCRLPLLPGGGPILSHDLVEAARLHAAGWAVRVLPDETGSEEGHPPDLVAMLERDVRWAAGNLQYRHLLRRRDLGPVGRLQMLQAIGHYALTPLWFAPLPLAALNVLTGGGEGTPRGPILALLGVGFGLLHVPKLAGYAEALARAAPGPNRVGLRSMLAETAFSILLDSIAAFDRTLLVLRLARGRVAVWEPQRREADRLSWSAAVRRFYPHTLAGFLLMVGFAGGGWFPLLASLPATLGLAAAIPFAVLTARARMEWTRSAGRSAKWSVTSRPWCRVRRRAAAGSGSSPAP